VDLGGGLGDAPVQLAYLGDEVHGEAAQGFAGDVAGTDPAQELGGPQCANARLARGPPP
jgi:hypothetical protein